MKANGEAIRKFDVAYFAASCDTVEEDTKFASRSRLSIPSSPTPTCETAKKYALIKGNGKNAARVTYYISPDGKIAAIDREVKTGTHGQDIAAKLKELGVKERRTPSSPRPPAVRCSAFDLEGERRTSNIERRTPNIKRDAVVHLHWICASKGGVGCVGCHLAAGQ